MKRSGARGAGRWFRPGALGAGRWSAPPAPPSEVAVLVRRARFESEQTPISRTGRRFRSAAFNALRRIRLGTCGFVPVLYFYSEINE